MISFKKSATRMPFSATQLNAASTTVTVHSAFTLQNSLEKRMSTRISCSPAAGARSHTCSVLNVM